MISANINETGRIEVNFKEKELAGLKAILSGKGFSFSFIYLFMMCMFIIIFFLLVPLAMDLEYLFFRIGIVLVSLGLSVVFVKSIIEIVVEEDNIQFVIFKKPKKYILEKIREIRLYYFTMLGLGAIHLKAEGESGLFFVLAPNFERERYQLFLKLVEILQGNQRLRGRVKYKS